jgi:hypothetical protein
MITFVVVKTWYIQLSDFSLFGGFACLFFLSLKRKSLEIRIKTSVKIVSRKNEFA